MRAYSALIAVAFLSSSATAQPVLSSISKPAAPTSGRIVLRGTGFGDGQGSATVEVGGFTALNARWEDSRITAYIPANAPTGPTSVRVNTPFGLSEPIPFTILPPPAPAGRITWRFESDSLYHLNDAALGADGTLYTQDVYGFVYALDARGQLRWVFNSAGYPHTGVGNEGPIAIGPDGTIYCIGDTLGPTDTLFALAPDGQVRWSYTEPNTFTVIAGPDVGPDGKVYVCFDTEGPAAGIGSGLMAFYPDGSLAWNNPGTPRLNNPGGMGAHIVFGAATPGQPADQVYASFSERHFFNLDRLYAFGLQNGEQRWAVLPPSTQSQNRPLVGLDGSIIQSGLASGSGYLLRAFAPANGAVRWTFHPAGVISSPTDAAMGPDGAYYVGFNLNRLYAVNPTGTQRWFHSDPWLIQSAAATPDNTGVLAQGVLTYGQPGFFKMLNAVDGSERWSINLGTEGPFNIIAGSTTPLFTPDSRRALVTAYLNSYTEGDEHAYVMALDIAPPCTADYDQDGDTGTDRDIEAFFSCLAGRCCPTCPINADFNHDGDAGTDADIEVFFRVLAGGTC